MGFNINISRNLEPYDKQFGGKVTFYKDVKFEKSITISGDLVVNGNITAAGSSGLTAENLKGGEQGSIPYQDGVNSTTFLPPTNAAGRFLKSNGPGQDPEWVSIGGGSGGGESVGTIVAWAGTAANIPSDYQLCDGSAASTTELQAITGANVPDLRDRFVIGASDSTGDTTYPGLSPTATGGSANAVLIAHSHTYDRATQRNVADGGVNGAYVSSLTGDTTDISGVDNAGNSSTSQTGTNANLPPYYALCYIIKHTTATGGGGVLDLDGLQDVDNDVINATNGQIIRYNSSTGKWERFTPNYLTAETSHADVVIDGDFTSEGLMKRGSSAGTYSIVADNSSNWDTAFSWGNHASVGYIEDSDFSSNGFMKRTGAGTYTVDSSTYISNINSEDLGDLSNVNVPASPTFGHILKWTGSAWTAEADAGVSAGAGVDGALAGTVSMWSGTASSVPNGYLLCDGSAVNRVTYTALFNAIGTAHGAGDGSTTFNLPNLRNRFVVGEGTSYALAATGGSADATLVSHSHNVNGNTNNTGDHGHSGNTSNTGDHSHSGNTNNTGGHSHNTNTAGGHSHSYVRPDQDNDYDSGNPIGSSGDIDDDFINANTSNAGAHAHNTNNDGSHSHNVNINNAGSHSHNVNINNAGSHSHNVNGNTDSQGSSATGANLPPYYALCYVIKVTSGGAITATDSLTLTSTDAGAAAAPTITLVRDSATPAANDIIGQIDFKGEDSGSGSDSYAKIQGKITDPTSGSEDGTLEVVVKTGGNDQTIAFPTTSGTLALTSDLSSAFPSGGIIMWSGAEGDIPNGWLLCNGQGSTPDLRNRFVVGAGTGSSYSVDDTGGSNDAIIVSHSHGSGNYGTNNTGSHSHGGGTNNTGGHSHGGSTNNTGAHAHRWGTDDAIGAQGGNNNPDANGGTNWRAWTDTQGAHSHNINTNNDGSHSHNINTNNDGGHSHNVSGNSGSQGSSGTGANRPPYYALCFIMKT